MPEPATERKSRLRADASLVASTRMIEPSLTLSPVLTLISRTVPESGAGTSIVALSELERDQRILRLHAVAGLDEDFDDRNVLEVADVGDAHLGDARRRADRRRRSADDRASLGLLRARALELHDHRAFAHLVANLHDHRLHHAIARRRHLHGRLVGLQRDQRILGLHLVARLDEDLDHRDVLEVTDVGNLDVDQTTHRSVLGSAALTRSRAQRARRRFDIWRWPRPRSPA